MHDLFVLVVLYRLGHARLLAHPAAAAPLRVDDRDERIDEGISQVEEAEELYRRCPAVVDRFLDILRPRAGARYEDALHGRIERPQLDVGLEEELVLVEADLEEAGNVPGCRRGRHADGQDGKVELPLERLRRKACPHPGARVPSGVGMISATFARVKSTPFSCVSSKNSSPPRGWALTSM